MDRVGIAVLGIDLAHRQLHRQLGEEERIAAGGLVTGPHEERLGVGQNGVPEDAGDRVEAERLRAQDGRGGVGAQLVEQRVRLGRMARGDGQDHRDGQLLDPLGEVDEEAHGRRIAPVGIVDAQHQRALFGEVGAQPVETVERGREALRSRGAFQHERGGKPGRPCEEALPLGVVKAADGLLEELQRPAEGEVALQVAAACAEHPGAVARREGRRLAEEPRLPEPLGRLDEDDTAASRLRIAQREAESLELRVALQQYARQLGRQRPSCHSPDQFTYPNASNVAAVRNLRKLT